MPRSSAAATWKDARPRLRRSRLADRRPPSRSAGVVRSTSATRPSRQRTAESSTAVSTQVVGCVVVLGGATGTVVVDASSPGVVVVVITVVDVVADVGVAVEVVVDEVDVDEVDVDVVDVDVVVVDVVDVDVVLVDVVDVDVVDVVVVVVDEVDVVDVVVTTPPMMSQPMASRARISAVVIASWDPRGRVGSMSPTIRPVRTSSFQ